MSEVDEERDGKIACRICGEETHIIKMHLKERHPELTLEEYRQRFPDAPILSRAAQKRLEERRRESVKSAEETADLGFASSTQPFHEVFGLGPVPAAMNGRTGEPLPIKVYDPPAELAIFVPEKDQDYVFDIDLLKSAMMAHHIGRPMLAWGMSGTGKSSIVEQLAAHLNHPWLRVQHTRNTEESHILGQWIVRDGATVFELGPLAFCMKYGLIYCADEYDFAMPAVLSLYQPVLEGKPLIIKDADMANRVIKPHPNFRFYATGNTNGTGDETGLYQGTLVQNAANYERFAIVEEVKYMPKIAEVAVITKKAGVKREIAERIVDFATMCREAFAAGKLGLPPSPRATINAALVGRLRGDFQAGIVRSYINRLPRVDQEAAFEVLRRVKFA